MINKIFQSGGFMGLDRVLCWNKIVPTNEQVKYLLEDYFNIPGIVGWVEDEKFFSVLLPGASSSPARRVRPEFDHTIMWMPEREIQVSSTNESIFITTRSQDPFTNDLAEGLTKRIKWIFEARDEFERGD